MIKKKKPCVKFATKEGGEYAYYVHMEKGISAPPEGISFRIRPMNDNQFIFNICGKRQYYLTNDYEIHRNCKIPIGEESEYLIDVRSLAYSEPKNFLTNDISGFWLQTISKIIELKKQIKKETQLMPTRMYSISIVLLFIIPIPVIQVDMLSQNFLRMVQAVILI